MAGAGKVNGAWYPPYAPYPSGAENQTEINNLKCINKQKKS